MADVIVAADMTCEDKFDKMIADQEKPAEETQETPVESIEETPVEPIEGTQETPAEPIEETPVEPIEGTQETPVGETVEETAEAPVAPVATMRVNTRDTSVITAKLADLSLPVSGVFDRCVFRYVEHLNSKGLQGLKTIYPQTMAYITNINSAINALVYSGEPGSDYTVEKPTISVCDCQLCKTNKGYDKIIGEDVYRFVDSFIHGEYCTCYHCGLLCPTPADLGQHFSSCLVHSYDVSQDFPGRSTIIDQELALKWRAYWTLCSEIMFGVYCVSAGLITIEDLIDSLMSIERLFIYGSYGIFGLRKIIVQLVTDPSSPDINTICPSLITILGVSIKRLSSGFGENKNNKVNEMAALITSLPDTIVADVFPGNWANPYDTPYDITSGMPGIPVTPGMCDPYLREFIANASQKPVGVAEVVADTTQPSQSQPYECLSQSNVRYMMLHPEFAERNKMMPPVIRHEKPAHLPPDTEMIPIPANYNEMREQKTPFPEESAEAIRVREERMLENRARHIEYCRKHNIAYNPHPSHPGQPGMHGNAIHAIVANDDHLQYRQAQQPEQQMSPMPTGRAGMLSRLLSMGMR